MRFRELYQADFAHITPSPRLLAATQALWQRQPPRRLYGRYIRAAAGLAACLLLAVGLSLGLPAQDHPSVPPSQADQTNQINTLQSAAYQTGSGDSLKMSRLSAQEETAQEETARQRLAAAPQTASLPPSAENAVDAQGAAICGLPLADALRETAAAYDSDCLTLTEGIIEENIIEDEAPSFLFAVQLLRPAPDSAAYLARCGLWLARYIRY